MRNKNFLEDERVSEQYRFWLDSPTVGEHWSDKQRLYHFVISCVNYVKDVKFLKKEEAWKKIDLNVLKKQLLKDVKGTNDTKEFIVHEMIVQFEELLEYEKKRSRWTGEFHPPTSYPHKSRYELVPYTDHHEGEK